MKRMGVVVFWVTLVALLLPTWPYSTGWSYIPAIGITLAGLVFLMVMNLLERDSIDEAIHPTESQYGSLPPEWRRNRLNERRTDSLRSSKDETQSAA